MFLSCTKKIFFKIRTDILLGARIRTITDKVELFYHFPHGSNVEAELENIENGEVNDGYLSDHISFHTDGNIHSKAKNGEKKKIYLDEINIGLNVFNLERGHYLPFFIESIDISDIRFIKRRFKENVFYDPNKDILWDVSKLNSFSILLISKCEKFNPHHIIQNEHLKNLKIISADIILSAFTKVDKQKNFKVHSNLNSDLMIILIENVWDKFTTVVHHVNKDLGENFSTIVCVPPIERIGKMINLNQNR